MKTLGKSVASRNCPPGAGDSPSIVFAGVAYFAIVFAAGFLLGALRVLLVAPRTGEFAAVAFELPIMLLIAWIAAARLIRECRLPPAASARLTMGIVAFLLLQAAETALGLFGFGRSIHDQLAAWGGAAGMLGLAGQLAFGLIPLLIGRLEKPRIREG